MAPLAFGVPGWPPPHGGVDWLPLLPILLSPALAWGLGLRMSARAVGAWALIGGLWGLAASGFGVTRMLIVAGVLGVAFAAGARSARSRWTPPV